MRKFEISICTFDELSAEAKKKAINGYIATPALSESFHSTCEDDLGILFPDSRLKVEFSLSSCQGDGLNIYGSLDVKDFVRLTEKAGCGCSCDPCGDDEIKALQAFHKLITAKACGGTIKDMLLEYADTLRDGEAELPVNTTHYSYCFIDHIDLPESENDGGYVSGALQHALISFFTAMCRRMEKEGYDFLYNMTEDEMSETSSANGWEYLEDGTFYHEGMLPGKGA